MSESGMEKSLNKSAGEVAFMKALSLTDKKARFPGFHQRKINYDAGQRIVAGHMALPSSMVLHESTPMSLGDGVRLYSDIFLPTTFQDISETAQHTLKVPALIAWSPYGKQLGTTRLDDFPMRMGVPRGWTSGLEKWEGPDPAFWCSCGYGVVNVDTRGAYTSEGNLLILGQEEAADGAQFATWVSEQPWCNGKVAFTGNSWLAISQWSIGSLRPKGLAALAPWEGFHDLYREHICSGGVPSAGFVKNISSKLASQGRLEDIPTMLERNPLWNDYWEGKKSKVSNINVPVYVVASWTNPLHTPGTFNAWSQIRDDVPKWLRVHNGQEWPDYYTDANCRDLKRFFDYYLKDRTDNGWLSTPKVRLSILNFGLGGRGDTVGRAETDFPLPRTQYVRYHLTSKGHLSTSTSDMAGGKVSYSSNSGKAIFRYTMPQALEITGYPMAHLVMSSEGHDEMDVFVQIEKLGPSGTRQGVMSITPPHAAIRALFKMMHDWQIGVEKVGPLFHWGPSGVLRASHALGRDDVNSSQAQPKYLHTLKVPLKAGEPRILDIPIRPCGIYWQKGDTLQFTVSGKEVLPFPIPGVKPAFTDNKGSHVIHCSSDEETSSYLLMPHV